MCKICRHFSKSFQIKSFKSKKRLLNLLSHQTIVRFSEHRRNFDTEALFQWNDLWPSLIEKLKPIFYSEPSRHSSLRSFDAQTKHMRKHNNTKKTYFFNFWGSFPSFLPALSVKYSFFPLHLVSLPASILSNFTFFYFTSSIRRVSFVLFFAQHISCVFARVCLMDVKLGTSLLFAVTYCSRTWIYFRGSLLGRFGYLLFFWFLSSTVVQLKWIKLIVWVEFHWNLN